MTFREIAAKLEERGESGQWLKRVRELEYEVEKRVPEFTVVVGMVQQKTGGSSSKLQIAKEVLLTESGLRLLWFYQKLLSRMVINVKFDVGKLLLNILSSSGAATGDEGQTAFILGDNKGFDLLRQLRVLRILQESDQFGWLNKFGENNFVRERISLTWTQGHRHIPTSMLS
jgi:nucleolar pre-ribosomal-associated protein 1